MAKLVEPYKSAECYIFWKGACHTPGISHDKRVWYKKVRGILFWKKKLLTWHPIDEKWRASAHFTIPRDMGEIIKIENSERKALQNQVGIEQELSPEDLAWAREQQAFIRREAAKRKQRDIKFRRQVEDRKKK